MKIIDISRELFSAKVYPGDPSPELSALCRIRWGDVCNTSSLNACLHNGTHADAPLHFVSDGDDIADIPVETFVGECVVVEWDGVLLGEQAEQLWDKVTAFPPRTCERLLIKGSASLSPSAAFVLAGMGLKLIGVEAQSVADSHGASVHSELLGAGIALIEGLDLSGVSGGWYFLFAAPVKIKGADGAPVRAVLIESSRRLPIN